MNFIQKINQFLIERYPTVWNTKLVWMISISLLVHLLSFIAGIFAYSNPIKLQDQYVTSEYFSNGTILFHIIISVIMIVVWLFKMFQNNAFKNFYPMSKTQLFMQFIQYIVIILFSTTFYISYMFGVQTYINSKYPDEAFAQWKETTNLGLAFMPQAPEKYSLPNRKFPDEFSNLFCETDRNKIDFSKPYYEAYGDVYQYNTLTTDTIHQKKNSQVEVVALEVEQELFPVNIDDPKVATYEQFDGYVVVYYKKDYVDLSDVIKTTELSFYNFSSLATDSSVDFYNSYDMYGGLDYQNDKSQDFEKRKYRLNKKIHSLLSTNDKAKVQEIMTDFMKLSKELNITTNMSVEQWMPLVFNGSEHFLVKNYVSFSKEDLENKDVDAVYQNSYKEIFDKNRSKYIYSSQDLLNSISAISSFKSLHVFTEYLSVYLWLSTIFSLLIFSFRVTNIRTIIFAGVSFGVIGLVLGLFSIGFGLLSPYDYYLYIFGFYLLVGLVILAIPIITSMNGSKNTSAVLMVMGICEIPFLVFGLLRYIAEVQTSIKANADDMYSYYPTFLDNYSNETISIIVFILSLIVLYFYISVVMKWKAATE